MAERRIYWVSRRSPYTADPDCVEEFISLEGFDNKDDWKLVRRDIGGLDGQKINLDDTCDRLIGSFGAAELCVVAFNATLRDDSFDDFKAIFFTKMAQAVERRRSLPNS